MVNKQSIQIYSNQYLSYPNLSIFSILILFFPFLFYSNSCHHVFFPFLFYSNSCHHVCTLLWWAAMLQLPLLLKRCCSSFLSCASTCYPFLWIFTSSQYSWVYIWYIPQKDLVDLSKTATFTESFSSVTTLVKHLEQRMWKLHGHALLFTGMSTSAEILFRGFVVNTDTCCQEHFSTCMSA